MPENHGEKESFVRWRLILGESAEEALGRLPDELSEKREMTLSYLYDREYGHSRNVRKGPGSLDDSQLTIPDWINAVHELFPRKTVERIEKDALERYKLEELVTSPDSMARARPSMALLKAVLRTKHLMSQEVLAMARALVAQVVGELRDKLMMEVKQAFSGSLLRHRRSLQALSKNFDARLTIIKNLRHYNRERRCILMETPYFFSRQKRSMDRWKIIILVDQSGSMAESVIYSSVMASIFTSLPVITPRLVLFDTNIVDMTCSCVDPVETLMKVQLGGGTDIGHALSYAASLVEHPHRTMVIVISDFFEGGPLARLISLAGHLVEGGVTLLCLGALDAKGEGCYNREVAEKLAARGAHVAAMTPDGLAQWVAGKVRG